MSVDEITNMLNVYNVKTPNEEFDIVKDAIIVYETGNTSINKFILDARVRYSRYVKGIKFDEIQLDLKKRVEFIANSKGFSFDLANTINETDKIIVHLVAY